MVELSIYLNPIFDDDSFADRVHRAADAGADAVEFRPWDHEQRDAIVAAARERDLNVSYISGNDVSLTDPERTAEAVTEIAADAGARIRAVSRRSRPPARVCAAAPSAP